jgi:hypothetical protein
MDARQTVGWAKELLTGIPFRFRLETLIGYFLDQRDGLLLYAPIYFFSFLGFLEMLRRKRREALLLLFLAAPYILVSAFLTQRAGYSPQARPLVAVIWCLAIFLGYFLASGAGKLFGYLRNFAVGASLAFVGLLCLNPLALYQETTMGTTERGGALFYTLSNLHFYLPSLLPSFIKVENAGWTPNYVWPVILALFMAAYPVLRRRGFPLGFGHHLAIAGVGLAIFFAGFVYFPRTILVSPQKAVLPSGETIAFYSLSRVAHLDKSGAFTLLEDDRDYHFYFASRRPMSALRVRYGSLQGDYEIKLGFFDAPGLDETTSREIRTSDLDAPAAYRWRGLNLYRVTVRLDKRSAVQTSVNPYALAFRPVR